MTVQQNDIYRLGMRSNDGENSWWTYAWYAVNILGTEEFVAEGATTQFAGSVADACVALLSDDITVDRIEAMNWRVPTEDYHLEVVNFPGEVTSTDYSPVFVTGTFISSNTAPTQNASIFRLSGIADSAITDGQPSSSGLWDAIATALGASLIVQTATLNPIHIARQINKVKVFPALGTANPVGQQLNTGQWTYRVGSIIRRKNLRTGL